MVKMAMVMDDEGGLSFNVGYGFHDWLKLELICAAWRG